MERLSIKTCGNSSGSNKNLFLLIHNLVNIPSKMQFSPLMCELYSNVNSVPKSCAFQKGELAKFQSPTNLSKSLED